MMFSIVEWELRFKEKVLAETAASNLMKKAQAICGNSEHRHSAIRFVTPEQRHYGQDINLLEQRAQIYEQAKLKNPQRWKGRQTRDWEYKSSVWLNPPKEEQKVSTKLKSVA